MRERLHRALDALRGAETYVEIRLHRLWTSLVVYRDRRLEVATTAQDTGGTVRCLAPGHGWGVSAFTHPDLLAETVRRAHELSRAARSHPAVGLAPVPVRQEDLRAPLANDPREVALAEKRVVLEHLTRELLGVDRRVVETRTRLQDEVRETWFATSDGTVIADLRSEVSIAALAVAEENGTIERALGSLARRGGWELVAGADGLMRDTARGAAALLHAPPVRAGRYPVVLDPRSAGAVAHQAVGHLLGGDPTRSGLPAGTRLGPESLHLGDDGSAAGLRATAAFDEEGVATQNTALVRNGVVVGSLLSREHASRAGLAPTGNARSANPRDAPVPRLTNTYIAQGQGSLEDLLADIALGVYCQDVATCGATGGMVRVRAGGGRMIRQGRLAEPVKDITISADILSLFGRLEGVAGDFTWDTSDVRCDGGGAGTIAVTTGAPHLRFLDVAVGAGAGEPGVS